MPVLAAAVAPPALKSVLNDLPGSAVAQALLLDFERGSRGR